MRVLLLLLVPLALAVVAPTTALAQDAGADARPPAERFAAARQELLAKAADLIVDGSAVGRGAQPGRFYRLVVELSRTGQKEEFLALLEHEQVVVRAAGMVCLAQRFPEEAVPLIRARQNSQVKLWFNPTGCTPEEITEGDFASKLLRNAELLDVMRPARPLIEEKD